MGGGQNFGLDVARRGSGDLRRAVREVGAAGAANGGSLDQANDFCANSHRIRFLFTASKPPMRGDPVRLALGDPPFVMSGSDMIGRVLGAEAVSMNGCLRLHWDMVGEIAEFDHRTRKGVITLRGIR